MFVLKCLSLSNRDQDISSSGHKFELPKKSNLCPHPHISQASVQCWIFILAWLKYMYDVPLSPVYNWPHQVVRYQVTHFSVLLLWPWLPPPPPHGCQRASGETWKSSLNTFVQLTLPRMAYQIMWLSWGGGFSFTEFWFKRPALITRLQAGTKVATIYSNFLNQATWTLNWNTLITKVS